MTETRTIRGVVRKVFQNKRDYAVYLNMEGEVSSEYQDIRFQGDGKCPWNEGDLAEFECDIQCRGGGVYGDGIPGSDKPGESLLELLGLRAETDPTGFQHFANSLNLLLTH